MSDAPRQPGPRELRIQALWKDVWREQSSGGVFEPYIAIAESELARFGTTLPPDDPAAALDLSAAQNLHLFQSRHFAAHVGRIAGFLDQVSQSIAWTYDQISKFNEHAVRSLTVANGGIVIATLAYIQSRSIVPGGLILVIALGALGYLLTMLGSHLVVVLSAQTISILTELRSPRLSNDARGEKLKRLQSRSRLMVWTSRPVFYASAACLVAALYFGVAAITGERSVKNDLLLTRPSGAISSVPGKGATQRPKRTQPKKISVD